MTTYTHTYTNTFTEARVREVMHHVLGDFVKVANANLETLETLQEWFEEISYAVQHEVVDTFQLQFIKPKGLPAALSYTVRDDGRPLEAAKAGGFDPRQFPEGTRVRLCIGYRANARYLAHVEAYMRKRGWQPGGVMVEGVTIRDRTYSKNGYGIERSKVGDIE